MHMTTTKTKTKIAATETLVTKNMAAGAVKPSVKGPAKPVAEAVGAPSKGRQKLIRDSFTIPKSEYVVLDALKLRAAALSRPIKKSELLRAGITALSLMQDKAFTAALDRVPNLKTGRPKTGV